LDIKEARLLANNTEITRDTHNGTTGNEHRGNSYKLKLTDFAFGTKYSVSATIRSDGGNDSHGTIYIKKEK
jgi:hypothetical protein